MSQGFTLLKSTVNATYSLSSPVGYGNSGTNTAYLAIGSPYTLVVTTTFPCGIVGITNIVATWTGGVGQFLRAVDYAHDNNVLTEVTFEHSIVDTPGTQYSVTLSPIVNSFGINFFVGIPVGASSTVYDYSDTLSIRVTYEGGSQETVTFGFHFQLPQMTMNFNWQTTPSTKFQFGPCKYYHVSGTRVYDNVQVAWNDANYNAGLPANQTYFIGGKALAGSDYPFQFSGTGNNTTNSDGEFYLVQLINSSDNIKRYYVIPTETDWQSDHQDSSVYSPSSPYGLDSKRPGTGPTGYPWTWFTAVSAPAASGSLAVPATNSFPDFNGNLVSYYGRQEDSGYSFTGVGGQTIVLWKCHSTNLFKTHFVFQPKFGIPIGITWWEWKTVTAMDNPTCDTAIPPTWAQGAATQANWNGSCGSYDLYTPNQHNGPVYVLWNYVFDDLDIKTDLFHLSTPRYPKFFYDLNNRLGGTPIGGGAAGSPLVGIPGLPTKLAGNVSVMNNAM